MYNARTMQKPEVPPPCHPCTVEQWASRVLDFSSEYDNTAWAAIQALGPPKVYPQHGDISGTWATGAVDKHQYIEFELPVIPSAVHIYETFNPGGVVGVSAKDKTETWHTIFKAKKPVKLTSSRIFSPDVPTIRNKVNVIRLDVDCSEAKTWVEIDAVQLMGIRDGEVTLLENTSFLEDFKMLLDDSRYSDVKFEVDGGKVHAHKAILAARSASATFEIPDMKTAALHRFSELLKCDNVVDAFGMVENNESLAEAKAICFRFMSENLNEISELPAFKTLGQEITVQVVQAATAKLCVK